MPQLAFCANCGSERLDVTGVNARGVGLRCYTCTQSVVVEGVIFGEVDFLAGAKSKIEAMVARARDDAKARVKKGSSKPRQ